MSEYILMQILLIKYGLTEFKRTAGPDGGMHVTEYHSSY